MIRNFLYYLILSTALILQRCDAQTLAQPKNDKTKTTQAKSKTQQVALTKTHNDLAEAAESLTLDAVIYDPTYFVIPYPGGDVPADRGVCSDVVIRAYRKLGVDLQQLVHEDMKNNFAKYPQKWSLKKPDKNIDHRRVYNLMKFFERHGTTLANSSSSSDYQPGDIVAWLLPGNLTHIGVVSSQKSNDGERYMIVHNIGSGQVIEDCLFSWSIIGHYRYN
ncbi:MAG: DUF1287 domain-containing protein [Chitinophagales bacterium]|jgi:hypothetical protein|nr:DUF1287 domain-containing protein [Chitinophagales bacterium]